MKNKLHPDDWNADAADYADMHGFDPRASASSAQSVFQFVCTFINSEIERCELYICVLR